MEEIIKHQDISDLAIKQDLRGVSLIHLYKNTVLIQVTAVQVNLKNEVQNYLSCI